MDGSVLLQRMASISPGVRLHITGRMWIVNIDPDEITEKLLVNECFALMINEAFELGIEFYCTLGDLAESYVTIDQTLVLFELLYPTPLYRSITESDSFKNMISSVTIEGAEISGESSVITILEYLAVYNDDSSSTFSDTYSFLKDKMKSTQIFDQYVNSILEVANTPMAVQIDQNVIITYLQHIQSTYSKLLKLADHYFYIQSPLSTFSIDRDSVYDSIEEYKTTAIESDNLNQYSWAFNARDDKNPTPVIQALIEKYRIQFCQSIPFYDEYFISRKVTEVTNVDIFTLILGVCIDTETTDAFVSKVQDSFKVLQANGVLITNEQNSLIQQISLMFIQEIYS